MGEDGLKMAYRECDGQGVSNNPYDRSSEALFIWPRAGMDLKIGLTCPELNEGRVNASSSELEGR